MSDLFKSAFGYFTSANSQAPTNDLVGQTVEVGYSKLRVKRVIAEGGFAFVYVAQALDSGKEYALKRLLAADEEANQRIVQEINTLKKLAGHPNIIQFIAVAFVDKNQSGHGMAEYLLLTELCSGGSLVEVLQRRSGAFPPEVVCKIMWQTCKAVQHMHSQSPPIIHRDLKIENLLLTTEGKIKLCDFGSATSQIFRPDSSWSAQQHAMLEDQMSSCTTPMYRAPEMVDTWENHEIGLASDVWAVGCLMYLLCYNKHPFEDSAKLRILNANYTLPPSDARYRCFHPVIAGCLVAQPSRRMNIAQVLERLAAIAESLRINPSEPIPVEKTAPNPQNNNQHEIKYPAIFSGSNVQDNNSSPMHSSANNVTRPAPPSPAPRAPSTNVSSSSGGIFSQIRGGAGNLLKNIRDTSSKVVQSVQQTMVRGEEMAASYITSRICVINYTEGPDTLQDMRCTIEARHNLANCAIYNLTTTQFPAHRFPNATLVESGWGKRCPSLQALYTLCEHMHHFLSNHQSNICFITCQDGRCNSAMLVSGFLLFVNFVTRPEDALQLFAVKRTPSTIQPSHRRYLEYFAEVLSSPKPTFTCKKVKIVAVTLQPVPLFNKIRDGCRPYVELYEGEDKVFTSVDDYDRMNVFNVSHTKVVLPVVCTVSGDVTVCVYHARQVLTRISPIKMLQIQFNTGFMEDDNVLAFSRSELDDIESGDHFQDKTTILVHCKVTHESIVTNSPWARHKTMSPNILFTSKLEAEETTDLFGT
ncbi:hypothetical protein AAG570_003615 [Ranatra chinensis]|uniref:Auxillin n=1 Tax=Ranatra chinensis TaxID=642074 RepID=A0ABD0Y483_9HEMI